MSDNNNKNNNKNTHKQMVFDTDKIHEATQKLVDGYILKRHENPWRKGEIGVRRSNVTFEMTEHEQEEYIKCALDPHHFAEKYCKVKREDGAIDTIPLRDYQEEILDNFVQHSLNILMASRQTGKCLSLMSNVLVYDFTTKSLTKTPLFELYFNNKENKTVYDRAKYLLYKIIKKIST